jgi:hypothetical protein
MFTMSLPHVDVFTMLAPAFDAGLAFTVTVTGVLVALTQGPLTPSM